MLDIRKQPYADYIHSISRNTDRCPNIVLIFVDDMGYGDLSCFGSRLIHTPCIDAMAESGARMDNFYAASPVCSPSRFSCLTGRYPTRGYMNTVLFPTVTEMGQTHNRANFPEGVDGIPEDEITVAEALRAGGYKTGIFGKWHLGDRVGNRPTDKGFDYFYGSYYSVDMEPYDLYRNNEIDIPDPVDKTKLTGKLTEEILSFIDQNKEDAFFIYYASPYPHSPAASGRDFEGRSKGGTYGDCVEELDWSVGQIREKIRQLGLAENTLIIFTSDNGPWFEGSSGYHRGRKGQNFDGGHIVPFVAEWEGHIPAGSVISETAMNIDFFPTFLKMAGIPLPDDRVIDGKDMMPLLTGQKKENVHDALYFINGDKVLAVRTKDDFKYMVRSAVDNACYAGMPQGPFLFDMKEDQNESYDVSRLYPEKVRKMETLIDEANENIQHNPRGWTDKEGGIQNV